MEEIWKEIKGYPNYQVSNMGRVKSLNYNRTGKEKIMKLTNDKDGYLLVKIYKNKKQTTHKVHRLVAEAFLLNPDNNPEIDHINTDKTDNTVWLNDDGSVNYDKTNLRWVTRKGNMNNPLSKKNITIGKFGKNRGKEHFASKPIIQFTKNNEFVKIWENAQDVAREWGLYSGSNILSCCKGILKTAYGFKWSYADDYERIPFKVFDLEMYRKRVA